MAARDEKQLVAFMAQHLRHGGFDPVEGGRLLGIGPRRFSEYAAAAELLRPKRCAERCTMQPWCAFCASEHELSLRPPFRRRG